jgi:hypothetical protein
MVSRGSLRWLLERALLDAKVIALSMQSIGVHFERMVMDDPDFGAARNSLRRRCHFVRADGRETFFTNETEFFRP